MILQLCGSAGKSNDFAHSRQMLVIMLGNEEAHVKEIHGLLKARVKGRMGDHSFVKILEGGDKAGSFRSETVEQRGYAAGIVVCVEGSLIPEIGGGQNLCSAQEFLQP